MFVKFQTHTHTQTHTYTHTHLKKIKQKNLSEQRKCFLNYQLSSA